MNKTESELVDEFCKKQNLYDGLHTEEDRMMMRTIARDTILCNCYILRQRTIELINSTVITKFLLKLLNKLYPNNFQ